MWVSTYDTILPRGVSVFTHELVKLYAMLGHAARGRPCFGERPPAQAAGGCATHEWWKPVLMVLQ